MNGSWEIMAARGSQQDVLVAILTREIVHIHWALHLRDLRLPQRSVVQSIAGLPFDHARNHAVEMAVTGKFKYLFFIDDDVIVPPEAFEKLASHNLPVVSGLYFRRQAPLLPCCRRTDSKGILAWCTDLQLGKLEKVETVGAGCLLIKTEIFPKLGLYPFDWRCDRIEFPPGERYSEDFTFCRRVTRELNIPIYVDTSVVCQHIGHSESSFGRLSPL